MKRILALLLILSLLAGCTPQSNETTTASGTHPTLSTSPETEVQFTGIDDPNLHIYLRDLVYTELVDNLDSEDYFVDNVDVVYISKEYYEEAIYNAKENIYFGYTLSSLYEQFQGTRYVFGLDDNGQIIVKEFERYDDSFDQALRNVAIGVGVILVCATVSVVAGAVGAPAVSVIFAASAKTAATKVLTGSIVTGLTNGLIEGIETGDLGKAFEAAFISGSQGFKWAAIGGALSGGLSEFNALRGATLNGLTMNEAARIQQESGYPLSIIKQFHSVEEYTTFQQAGLQSGMVGDRLALVRSDIDLTNVVDEYGRTNQARLEIGLNPIDASGNPFEWHHIGQSNNGTLALLSQAEHNAGALHGFKTVSEIDRVGFDAYRKTLNRSLLDWLTGKVE